MKGRLYLIMDKTRKCIDIVDSIESIGRGKYIYEDKLKYQTKLADAHEILVFTTPEEYSSPNEFDKYCNNINELIDAVWKNRYNPEYQKMVADRCGPTMITLANYHDEDGDYSHREKFYEMYPLNNLAGEKTDLWIGAEGTIIGEGSCWSKIEWDNSLSSSSNGVIQVIPDAFKYTVTYQDDKDKPRKGFSRVANIISNYISAYPEGISSRDIEKGLRFGHPTVAGRISEMDDAGRITRIGGVKYCSKGKANSIWVISKE